MNTPNMTPEIIEAIQEHYKNDPDIAADCYLCLTNVCDNWELGTSFARAAEDTLQEMGRCTQCGSPLQYITYDEIHTELEGNPKERMTKLYCPNCDMKGRAMVD